jgi:predicted secreted Zn-dependent protease
MNPPPRSIRAEMNEALVGGIRDKGPEAFGMLITATARLVIAVVTWAVLYGVSQAAGYEVTPGPFVGMGVVSALTTWLLIWRRKP